MSTLKEHEPSNQTVSRIIGVKDTTDWKVAATLLDLANFPLEGSSRTRTKTRLDGEPQLSISERILVWHRETRGEDSMAVAGTNADLTVAAVLESKEPFKPTGKYLIEVNPRYIDPLLIEQIEPHIQANNLP